MVLSAFILLMAFTRLASSTHLSVLTKTVLDASLVRPLMDSSDTRISVSCEDALVEFEAALEANKTWANEMLDASGKIPPGALTGYSLHLGAYDECLNIFVRTYFAEQQNITGKYCAVLLNPDINSTAPEYIQDTQRWDLCVPNQCTAQDLEYGLSSIPEKYAISLSVPFCSVKTQKENSPGQIVSLLILMVLVIFLTIGTCTDIGIRGSSTSPDFRKKSFHNFFEKFSVYSNALRLLDTTMQESDLSALHGMKVMSTIWIIVAHSYYYLDWSFIGYTKDVYMLRTSFIFQSIMGFSLPVDTFFFLSGLLVMYVNLKKMDANPKINWCKFYLHRYCRLTPAFGFFIVIALLWPRIGSGPFWDSATSQAPFCEKNWWINLLYVHNFFGLEEPCFEHTWYLAADMQFYLLSPVFIYIFWKRPMAGVLLCMAYGGASMAITAALGLEYELLPTNLPLADKTRLHQLLEMYKLVYVKPYCRMGPYILGVITGYLIAKQITYPFSLKVKFVFWNLSIFLTATVVCGIYSWNSGRALPLAISVIHLAGHRSLWAFSIAWLTYACINGHAGIINSFLSWKPFVVLSRLSYTVYLFHVIILRTISGLMTDRLMFSGYLWIVVTLGIVVVIYALSFVAVVCVEEPFHRLESLLPSRQCRSSVRPCRRRQFRIRITPTTQQESVF